MSHSQNSVWLITGCSTGLGKALATYLLEHTSFRVVATARRLETLSTIPNSPNLLALELDVTSTASITSAIQRTLDTFSRIDVLINNAGYNILSAAEVLDPSAAHSILDTNFWGTVNLTNSVLPVLRDTNAQNGGTRGGTIVQITSVGGRLGFAGNAMYHASKFAVEGWTEAVKKEMRPEWGIRFCCIEPGGARTEYARKSVQVEGSHEGSRGEGKDITRLKELYEEGEGSVIGMLRKYHEDDAATEGWASAEAVAKVIVEVIRDGDGGGEKGGLPFRVPIGADSWGLQRKGYEAGLERLDRLKDVAFSVSKDPEAQLKGIEFLEV